MINILFFPKPLPEESPTSLLKRMAIRHGCRFKSDIQALLGKADRYRSIINRTHPIIQSIAKKAGKDAESFLCGFYEPIGPLTKSPPLKISGLVVRSSMVRKTSAAFCSECGEGTHEYFIKDLTLSVYCPYHFRKYLARCPHCNAYLYWTALLTGACICRRPIISPLCSPEDARIENKLLSLFRAGDAGQLKKFEEYLFLLGYQKKDKSECRATRTVAAMAFALLESDQESILYNLHELKSLYPEIPKRVICAKLALIPYHKIRRCVLHFLRQDGKEMGYQKKIPTLKTLTPFSLSKTQICAWQKLADHHWKILNRIANIEPHNSRYTWMQARILAERILHLKHHNGFSQKQKFSGLGVSDLQRELFLTPKVIKGLVSEKILTPIRGTRDTSLFDPSEVKIFLTKYTSIHHLSAGSQISTNRIRYAIRRLDLSKSDFNNRNLRLHVATVQTGRLIVDWCKNDELHKHGGHPQISSIQPRDKSNQTGVWLSTKEAGQSLGVSVYVIRHLIREGIITCYLRTKNGGGYIIKKDEVMRFKSKYISLTEISTLLRYPVTITRKVLDAAGIAPATGLDFDKHRPYYYLRRKIIKHAATVEKQRTEQGAFYTITETCQQLSLSAQTVLRLTRSGILKFKDPINRTIQKKCVDAFYGSYATLIIIANWLNIPARCTYQALARFGVMPISDIRLNSTRIYLIDDIAQHFSVPPRPNSASARLKKVLNIVSTSLLRKKYELPPVLFGKLFISSGFVRTIQAYGPAFLLADDALKICGILDEYLTFSQADIYLGARQLTRSLVMSNKLSIAHPLRPYSDHPMIEKNLLRNYALINPLV
jgi:excisionase family DNA binding protein